MADCEHLNPGDPPKDPSAEELAEYLLKLAEYLDCLSGQLDQLQAKHSRAKYAWRRQFLVLNKLRDKD